MKLAMRLKWNNDGQKLEEKLRDLRMQEGQCCRLGSGRKVNMAMFGRSDRSSRHWDLELGLGQVLPSSELEGHSRPQLKLCVWKGRLQHFGPMEHVGEGRRMPSDLRL